MKYFRYFCFYINNYTNFYFKFVLKFLQYAAFSCVCIVLISLAHRHKFALFTQIFDFAPSTVHTFLLMFTHTAYWPSFSYLIYVTPIMEQGQCTRFYLAAYNTNNRDTPIFHTHTHTHTNSIYCLPPHCHIQRTPMWHFASGQQRALQIKFPRKHTYFLLCFWCLLFILFYIVYLSRHHSQTFANCCT